MTDAANAAGSQSQDLAVIDTASPAAPAAKASEKHKVKIEDKEVEVDLEELKRGYGHTAAANRKFQEAASIQKQISGLLEQAKQGDLSWLKGLVPPEQLRKWQENELLDYIEYEKLPEAEKRARALEAEKERLAKELAEERRSKDEATKKELETKALKEIDEEIGAALEKMNRKASPRLVRRIAEQMYANLAVDGEAPLQAAIAAERAWKGLGVDVQEWLEQADTKEILERFPKAKLDAIRRSFVDEARPQAFARPGKNDEPTKPAKAQSGKSKRMSTDEWFQRMEQKLTRGSA